MTYLSKLNDSQGKKSDRQFIFNYLVDMKVILAHAADLDLLPSMSKIKQSIYELKSSCSDDYNDRLQSFLKETGLSEDDYWNSYVMYDAYNFYAAENLWKHIMQEGRSMGLIAPDNISSEDELSNYQYGYGDEYYFQERLKYKKTVNINIVTSIPELQYNTDLNKNYMYSGHEDGIDNLNDVNFMDKCFYNIEPVDEEQTKMNLLSKSNSTTDNVYKSYTRNGWRPVNGPLLYTNYIMVTQAYQYDSNGNQYVGMTDYNIYRTAPFYHPEIESNYQYYLYFVKGWNNSSIVFNSYYWQNGSNFGLIIPSASWDYWKKLKSYGGFFGSSGSYRLQTKGGVGYDEGGVDMKTYYTSYF